MTADSSKKCHKCGLSVCIDAARARLHSEYRKVGQL